MSCQLDTRLAPASIILEWWTCLQWLGELPADSFEQHIRDTFRTGNLPLQVDSQADWHLVAGESVMTGQKPAAKGAL